MAKSVLTLAKKALKAEKSPEKDKAQEKEFISNQWL